QTSRAEKGVHRSSGSGATWRAREGPVRPSQGKLVLILPISGRKLKSITVGIHYMVAASRFEASRNAAVVAWFMLKPAPG
ncbi:hypothetical protein, partial [Caballeronia arationis]|uniref:hypothetical protein n=1 Tax=Caballeronia arationis TaxID=1777142 RepID=UPI000AC95B82